MSATTKMPKDIPPQEQEQQPGKEKQRITDNGSKSGHRYNAWNLA